MSSAVSLILAGIPLVFGLQYLEVSGECTSNVIEQENAGFKWDLRLCHDKQLAARNVCLGIGPSVFRAAQISSRVAARSDSRIHGIWSFCHATTALQVPLLHNNLLTVLHTL